MPPKRYMAASVPRFLRQTKLGYIPINNIVGSRLIRGDGGANLYFDIIMLPVFEFQRMKSNVGLQHVVAPALKAGPTFQPGFVLADTKAVTVPENEPDPDGYAKHHFMIEFGLIEPDTPKKRGGSFSGTAKECTVKEGKKIRK